MNKIIFAAAAFAVAFAAQADTIAASTQPAPKERLNTLERKEKLEALVNQRVGGFLEKPGTAKGSIVYVNCQQKAPKSWIDESIAYFCEVTKFKVNYAEGTFDIKSPKFDGEVAIFIIEDETLPPILVAPEKQRSSVRSSSSSEPKRNSLAPFHISAVRQAQSTSVLLPGALRVSQNSTRITTMSSRWILSRGFGII